MDSVEADAVSARMSISDLPPKLRAEAERQLAGNVPSVRFKADPPATGILDLVLERKGVKTPGKRLRQSSKGMNKTEQAFFDHCLKSSPRPPISQAITLKLANGVRYTPDVIVPGTVPINAYEVKGFMRDDAAVKIKFAAKEFPWIRFWLVTRRGGSWAYQKILP